MPSVLIDRAAESPMLIRMIRQGLGDTIRRRANKALGFDQADERGSATDVKGDARVNFVTPDSYAHRNAYSVYLYL